MPVDIITNSQNRPASSTISGTSSSVPTTMQKRITPRNSTQPLPKWGVRSRAKNQNWISSQRIDAASESVRANPVKRFVLSNVRKLKHVDRLGRREQVDSQQIPVSTTHFLSGEFAGFDTSFCGCCTKPAPDGSRFRRGQSSNLTNLVPRNEHVLWFRSRKSAMFRKRNRVDTSSDCAASSWSPGFSRLRHRLKAELQRLCCPYFSTLPAAGFGLALDLLADGFRIGFVVVSTSGLILLSQSALMDLSQSARTRRRMMCSSMISSSGHSWTSTLTVVGSTRTSSTTPLVDDLLADDLCRTHQGVLTAEGLGESPSLRESRSRLATHVGLCDQFTITDVATVIET